MIIDDSLVVRKILEVSLRRAGIDQVSFSGGVEALRVIGSQPAYIPAVVVLDLYLPDMSGFTMARLLRSNPAFDTTAIIALTGYDSILSRLRARLARIDCYMTKPFKTAEILAAVSRYMCVQESAERAHNRGGEYANPIDDAATTGR